MDRLANIRFRQEVVASLVRSSARQELDAELSSRGVHIRRIVDALYAVPAIRQSIQQQRPDQEEPYADLMEESQEANRRLGEALVVAYDLIGISRMAEAISSLTDFAKLEHSVEHRALAAAEVVRLKAIVYET